MRAAAVGLAVAATLAGCRSTPPPGTGWSRAPDLSVYSAMLLYADIARQQSILCGGFSTASVEDHWRRDFGRRADAVEAGLIARHGAEAVGEAGRRRWRRGGSSARTCRRCAGATIIHRMLRLLETRLGLA